MKVNHLDILTKILLWMVYRNILGNLCYKNVNFAMYSLQFIYF